MCLWRCVPIGADSCDGVPKNRWERETASSGHAIRAQRALPQLRDGLRSDRCERPASAGRPQAGLPGRAYGAPMGDGG